MVWSGAGAVPAGGFGTLGAGFFLIGFFGGSVSSTTTFFGGAAFSVEARAFCRSLRNLLNSASFEPDRASMRSANIRREFSMEFTSFCNSW